MSLGFEQLKRFLIVLVLSFIFIYAIIVTTPQETSFGKAIEFLRPGTQDGYKLAWENNPAAIPLKPVSGI